MTKTSQNCTLQVSFPQSLFILSLTTPIIHIILSVLKCEHLNYTWKQTNPNTGTLTTASLPRANRLDVVWWLPWIQEGDMSLGAHSIYWPFTTIGQAHILTAIWQFGGEELKTQREEMHLQHYQRAQSRALFLDTYLWVFPCIQGHKVRGKKKISSN